MQIIAISTTNSSRTNILMSQEDVDVAQVTAIQHHKIERHAVGDETLHQSHALNQSGSKRQQL